MSQHSSLRVDSVGKKHRNVLKRLERIKRLEIDNRWGAASSVYNLPKVKSKKIKVKAIKEPKAEGAAGAETAKPAAGAGAPAAAATKAAAKPAAAAKDAKAAKPKQGKA